jgi:glycosyltransferase involved in cell wall biosynthesis
MHVSVIIPAHNEEKSLANVIGDLPRNLIQEIILVNNASTDRTGEIAEEMGCRVVDEAKRGYGQACLAGIAALNSSTDIVVFVDGDYSDHPDQLDHLIDPIIKEGYDFVVGSRALGRREKGAMTPQAYWGNKLACFLMRLFWKAQHTDLGPFRAIKFDALKRLKMSDRDFGWTIEMQIKAVERGLKVKEVPVDYRRRIGKSKISGTLKGTIFAGSKILWTIFKYKFTR